MFRVVFSTLVIYLLLSTAISGQSDVNKPNLLLIMVDDMGFGDLAMANNPHIHTPNLDDLASRSIQFEYFYVSSVCAPTRASLLTGRYHQRTGVQSVTNGWEVMHADEETLAEILADEGYHTGIFGKWHLGEYYPNLPNEQGFDTYVGFRTGHTANYYDAVLEKNGKPYQTSGYITNALTEEAWEFMSSVSGDPFLCYLPYNAPHTPLQIDSTWFLPYLERGVDERTARIYGMVENLDHHIGRLMDSLDHYQMLEQTMVIFLSDNGPINGWRVPQEEMRYNAGLRDQKFTVYEGGIRTQCFWMWKDHWRPRLVKKRVGAHIDLVPTMLDFLGLSSPRKSLDGVSLRPVLENDLSDWQRRYFFQKYQLGTFGSNDLQPGGMTRYGRWKMVNGDELYDLESDPGETNNLAEQKVDTLEMMNKAYTSWWESILETSDLERPPIEVGYNDKDTVFLQPHHGVAEGNLAFTGHRGLLGERKGTHPSGVDGDWLEGWSGEGDRITWKIMIDQDGLYEIGLQMACSAHTMITAVLCIGTERRQILIDAKGEYSRWAYLRAAEIELQKGGQEISFEVEKMTPDHNLAVRSLAIRKR